MTKRQATKIVDYTTIAILATTFVVAVYLIVKAMAEALGAA